MRAARERNWEFIGHGFSQKNMQKVADERDDIRKTTAAIREATGKKPARLARPRPDRDLGHPRPPGRGRLRLRLRLGARRPAGRAEDARQADRQHPLHAGMQRRRDDADPASQGERIPRPRHRPVRAALQRCAGAAPASWRWWCTPTSWARRTGSNTSATRSPISASHDDVVFWTGEQILDWYLGQRG